MKTLCKVKASHKRLHILWFHSYNQSWIGKAIETKSRLVVAQSGAGMGKIRDWVTTSYKNDGNVLKLITVMAAQACKYTKSHGAVHLMGKEYGLWIISQ